MAAQGISDAVRYTNVDLGGTARIIGVGGAFGAMGGDFSSLGINPAGIAGYNKGEFIFSPAVNAYKNEAYLRSDKLSKTEKSGSRFSLDNLAFISSSSPMASNWLTSNFAIGFNKIASFNNKFDYAGNTPGSITQRFAELANGRTLDQLDNFEAGLAWDTGAIFDFDGDNFYETDFDGNQAPVMKAQEIIQSGSISELALGWAGNFDNKFNIGVSMGIPFISYEEEKYYSESDPNNNIPVFEELRYAEYVETSATGINFKIGTILKATERVRLGVAIHTPTWYFLTDDYLTQLNYSYNDGTYKEFESLSPDGNFKYKFNTPWKLIGSVGTIFNLGNIQGFADIDVEYIDYRNGSFNFSAYSNSIEEKEYTKEVNAELENELDKALIIRMGTELVLADYWRVRGGYTISPSPFYNDGNNNAISGGFGYRGDGFFFDMGIRFGENSQGFVPYRLLDQTQEQVVNVDQKTTKVIATFGFKF
jgi:hypothetical protein